MAKSNSVRGQGPRHHTFSTQPSPSRASARSDGARESSSPRDAARLARTAQARRVTTMAGAQVLPGFFTSRSTPSAAEQRVGAHLGHQSTEKNTRSPRRIETKGTAVDIGDIRNTPYDDSIKIPEAPTSSRAKKSIPFWDFPLNGKQTLRISQSMGLLEAKITDGSGKSTADIDDENIFQHAGSSNIYVKTEEGQGLDTLCYRIEVCDNGIEVTRISEPGFRITIFGHRWCQRILRGEQFTNHPQIMPLFGLVKGTDFKTLVRRHGLAIEFSRALDNDKISEDFDSPQFQEDLATYIADHESDSPTVTGKFTDWQDFRVARHGEEILQTEEPDTDPPVSTRELLPDTFADMTWDREDEILRNVFGIHDGLEDSNREARLFYLNHFIAARDLSKKIKKVIKILTPTKLHDMLSSFLSVQQNDTIDLPGFMKQLTT